MSSAITTKPVDGLGMGTDCNGNFKVQLVGADGRGSSIWWEMTRDQALLLKAGLDAFMGEQERGAER